MMTTVRTFQLVGLAVVVVLAGCSPSSGSDAGFDAGKKKDAGIKDAGSAEDAGLEEDAGMDEDAGPGDAGTDARFDAGVDAGRDAGTG